MTALQRGLTGSIASAVEAKGLVLLALRNWLRAWRRATRPRKNLSTIKPR